MLFGIRAFSGDSTEHTVREVIEGTGAPSALLVKELKEGVLDGRKWFYYPSDVDKPCDDEAAVAEFDKLFPPKEKGWQPSQEEFFIHSHSVIRP
jgi:hypothetical protein